MKFRLWLSIFFILMVLTACGTSSAPPPPLVTRPIPEKKQPAARRPTPTRATIAPTASPTPPPPPTAATAVTAQISLTINPASPAGDIRPLLGINIGPIPAGNPANPDLTDAYHTIGVQMVRTHDFYGPLDMATLYPDQTADPADPASYDFSASDEVFRAILAGGFEPYLRLGDSWNAGEGFPPANPRHPTNPANWVQAAVQVVRHYRTMADTAGVPLRYVEIWNEPDGSQFWDDSPDAFYSLFAAAAVALKAEFPDLKIGGPGFSPAGALSPKGKLFSADMVRTLAEKNVPLDFLSWHIYSNNPQTFVDAAQFYRQLLDDNGYTQTESHISEWNTETRTANPAVRTGSEAAAILSAAWIGLQQQGVAVSTLYRGPDPDINAPTFLGIFYADARPKPGALAFSLWSELAKYPQVISTAVDDGSLWVLGGKNNAGSVAVLIANPTESTTAWALNVAGDAPEVVTIRQISRADETAVQTFTANPAGVTLPPFSVQLVLLP